MTEASNTKGGRKLGDYMGVSVRDSVRPYIESRARNLCRYVLEQGAQCAAGWWPGPLGMLGRSGIYRWLLACGSRAPFVESGVELFHMNGISCGTGVYIDSGCRLHASLACIELGEGTRIMRGAYLCSFVSNPRVGEGIITGRQCWIGVNAVLASGQGGIFLGNNVLIGPQAVLVTGNHEFHDTVQTTLEQRYTGLPIHIGDNVWIGTHAVILGGVSIGERSVIAAGAVVTEDVADRTIVGGVPAKPIRQIG